jgi:hypothetical protein
MAGVRSGEFNNQRRLPLSRIHRSSSWQELAESLNHRAKRRLLCEILSGNHKTIASAGQAAGYRGPGAYRALKNLRETISEIMDQAVSDAYVVQNCLRPLLHATQVKLGQYKGKFKDSVEVADNDARLRALDIALRIKGKYAPPAVEQPDKHTVKVLVLDCPRPKRDHPPPTVIEIANREPSPNVLPAKPQNVLPQSSQPASQAASNVLPSPNVLPHKDKSNGVLTL